MRTNELRQGNWVRLKSDTEIEAIVLDVYGNYGVALQGNGVNNPIEDIEGIPLTEGWILRLGFEYANDPDFDKYADAKVYFKGSLQIGIRKENNKKIWRHVVYLYGYPITTDSILYVHSVQNLAFALMCDELTIK